MKRNESDDGETIDVGPVVEPTEAVDPMAFVERMERHWEHDLGNVPNPALRETWGQMADEFNRAIARTRAGTGGKWRVLTPETGTGKTEGAILFCSMLPPTVGVLVVEELLTEANRVADEINRFAGDRRAVAVHSEVESPLDPAEIAKFQVVVVTHRAFLQSLDASNLVIDMGGEVADPGTRNRAARFSSLRRWADGERSLTIIDEAPALIEPVGVYVQELDEVLAVVPESVWSDFPSSKEALGLLRDRLRKAEAEARSEREQGTAGKRKTRSRHRILWTFDSARSFFGGDTPDDRLSRVAREFIREIDLSAFRSELQTHHVRSYLQSWKNPDAARENHERLVDIVRSAGLLLSGFIHQSTRKGLPTEGERSREFFQTGRSIVPSDTSPAVILDATGQSNPIYPLLENVEVLPRARPSRTYGQVTLHVGRLRGLGKHATLKNIRTRIPQLSRALRSALDTQGDKSDRRVLCVTHKDVVPAIVAQGDMQRRKVAHWNSFPGSNMYRSFPAVAFFTLLFPNDVTSELEFNAARGVQPEEWFGSEEAKGVLFDMRVHKVANSLVQAINRVQCREPIDGDGNCKPTDVFLPLPHGKRGDRILEIVEEQMPGVRKVPWDLRGVDGATRQRRGRLNVLAAVTRKVEQMEPGDVVLLRDLQAQIGCQRSRLNEVVRTVADPNTDLARIASERGVRYMRGRLQADAA